MIGHENASLSQDLNTLISIVIPTYNSEEYIGLLLQKIANQTYPHFEVLIMDNISTDHTIDIVKKHSNADTRIQLYSRRDKGIYEAMNEGIKTQGENGYILPALTTAFITMKYSVM